MTGAPVPVGADAVQQVELTHELKDNTVVELLQSVEQGRSIVRRGSEITAGETVLQPGISINPAMLAVLASFGYAQVEVGRKPRVGVLATGSELVAVDQTPGQDQIRDSNNFSIGAYAERAGALSRATSTDCRRNERIEKHDHESSRNLRRDRDVWWSLDGCL